MSRFTHAQCEPCWNKARGRETPARVRDNPPAICCYCGQASTSGIYVRADPSTLHCQGRAGEHEQPVA